MAPKQQGLLAAKTAAERTHGKVFLRKDAFDSFDNRSLLFPARDVIGFGIHRFRSKASFFRMPCRGG